MDSAAGRSYEFPLHNYSGGELNASRQPTKADQSLNHDNGPPERIAGADDRGSVSPLTHENSLSSCVVKSRRVRPFGVLGTSQGC